MSDEQPSRLAVALARQVAKSRGAGLTLACVDLLNVSAVGITIMSGGHAGPMGVSNREIVALEDLQYMTGVGPCQDAFRASRSVHVPHLDSVAAARWPSFIRLVEATGFGAVFAYPMSSSGANIGVMTLYQDREGELSDVQHEDSTALSDVLAETVLSIQDDAPAGTLAPGLEDTVAYRAEIYQASGMVAVQLSIPPAEALLRIRAHAFADSRPVGSVAADVVARRLRLTDDRPGLEERPIHQEEV